MKPVETGARAVDRPELGIRVLHRARGDVDDAPEALRYHAVDHRADHQDRAIMLASSALIQVSRSQSRKSPGGGPPALLTRMSGVPQARSAACLPSSL